MSNLYSPTTNQRGFPMSTSPLLRPGRRLTPILLAPVLLAATLLLGACNTQQGVSPRCLNRSARREPFSVAPCAIWTAAP
jgi:hypothetical protein